MGRSSLQSKHKKNVQDYVYSSPYKSLLRLFPQIAILNANYMAARLRDHYDVLFIGDNGKPINAHHIRDAILIDAT